MSTVETTGTAAKLYYKSMETIRRYSPEILTTVGVLGVVTSGVLSARATLKLEPIIERHEIAIDTAKKKTHDLTADEYSSTQHKREITKVYLTTSKDLFKLYALPVSIGIAGIGCLVSSHGIMSQRNVATVAAYKALETSFGEYRKRVVADLGEEKDREYRYAKTATQVEVVDEEGNVSVEEQQTHIVSSYERVFDELNPNWSDIPGMNQLFIKQQQNWLNDRLDARGYIFLNEVYKSLGFEDVPEGQVVGWLKKENPLSKDGYIDFGVFDRQTQVAFDFVDGFEKACLLDFNIDGIMFDKINL
jgi:hypothetical protein